MYKDAFDINNLQRFMCHKTKQIGYGWKIHQLHRYRGLTPPANDCPSYDTKQSDGEAPVMLWGMQSTPSLPLLPGPLWPGVVAPDRVLSIYQTEPFDI